MSALTHSALCVHRSTGLRPAAQRRRSATDVDNQAPPARLWRRRLAARSTVGGFRRARVGAATTARLLIPEPRPAAPRRAGGASQAITRLGVAKPKGTPHWPLPCCSAAVHVHASMLLPPCPALALLLWDSQVPLSSSAAPCAAMGHAYLGGITHLAPAYAARMGCSMASLWGVYNTYMLPPNRV